LTVREQTARLHRSPENLHAHGWSRSLPSSRKQLVPLTGSQSLADAFAARVVRSPEAIAYQDLDARKPGW